MLGWAASIPKLEKKAHHQQDFDELGLVSLA